MENKRGECAVIGSRWRWIGSILAWVCLFGPVPLTAQQSPSQNFWHVPRNGFWSFQLENDLFAINEKNGDKHYTNGFEFNYLFEHRSLPGHDMLLALLFNCRKPIRSALALSLGQKMFTPENISTREIDHQDRPYAGWLYLSVASYYQVEHNNEIDTFYGIEYTFGAIGPNSMAEESQSYFHRLIGADEPQGWDNQLRDEPGININLVTKWQISPRNIVNISYDISPHVSTAVGNVYTYAGAGVMLRFGKNLDSDIGPPNIRPGFPGAAVFDSSRQLWSWYFFAGHESRLVAYDIFLDGNTIHHSHKVDKENLVGDYQIGLVLRYRNLRFSISNVLRTKEFNNQDKLTQYGAINLSISG